MEDELTHYNRWIMEMQYVQQKYKYQAEDIFNDKKRFELSKEFKIKTSRTHDSLRELARKLVDEGVMSDDESEIVNSKLVYSLWKDKAATRKLAERYIPTKYLRKIKGVTEEEVKKEYEDTLAVRLYRHGILHRDLVNPHDSYSRAQLFFGDRNLDSGILSIVSIQKILKQVHQDAGIESSAIAHIQKLLLQVSAFITDRESIIHYFQRFGINESELLKHGLREYDKFDKRESGQIAETRAESFIEYLAAEILELAGNIAQDIMRGTEEEELAKILKKDVTLEDELEHLFLYIISIDHINEAIDGDEELMGIFGNSLRPNLGIPRGIVPEDDPEDRDLDLIYFMVENEKIALERSYIVKYPILSRFFQVNNCAGIGYYSSEAVSGALGLLKYNKITNAQNENMAKMFIDKITAMK